MIDAVRRYPPADLRTLVRAWLQFAWVDLVIRLRPYPAWRHWLDVPPERDRSTADAAAVARLIALSEVAGRHHWSSMNCLRRCLVQKRLLAACNVAATLQVGVRESADGALEAHAWLTDGARLLNDTPTVVSGYRPLQAAFEHRLPGFTQR
ncbi:MAG: lasso peptide biosynthesis B2 protein [Gammaproteobacteria bacterium]|nr:lasso peptide biosynthesis B2 protein [Gammaproteobacteria bacterium]